MEFLNEKLKGSITIYVTLFMLVFLTFLLFMLQAVRTRSMKTRIEIAMDCGIQSMLAGYHQELFRQFDLLYIDGSYGNKQHNAVDLERKIKEYMSYNLQPEKNQYFLYTSDFYGLSIEDILITNRTLATDHNGNSIKQQAIWVMKQKTGLPFLETLPKQLKIVERSKEGEDRVTDFLVEFEKTQKATGKTQNQQEDNLETQVYLQTNQIIEKRMFSLMEQIFKGDVNFSSKMVVKDQYPSGRELNKGDENSEIQKEDSMMDHLLLGEYCMEYFGNYIHPKESSYLRYQIEYLLHGSESDYENLEQTIWKIFLIREGANFLYLHTDEKKETFIDQIAGLLSALIGAPQLKDVFKNIFLFVWSYGESIEDMKGLMQGEKIIFFKTEDTWQLDLAELLFFSNIKDLFTKENDNKQAEKTKASTENINYFDYETYLRILLFAKAQNDKVFSMMDLIEMDIRQGKGNEFFRLDHCYENFDAEVHVQSRFGDRFHIMRTIQYD